LAQKLNKFRIPPLQSPFLVLRPEVVAAVLIIKLVFLLPLFISFCSFPNKIPQHQIQDLGPLRRFFVYLFERFLDGGTGGGLFFCVFCAFSMAGLWEDYFLGFVDGGAVALGGLFLFLRFLRFCRICSRVHSWGSKKRNYLIRVRDRGFVFIFSSNILLHSNNLIVVFTTSPPPSLHPLKRSAKFKI
jgi:hypothetical protein